MPTWLATLLGAIYPRVPPAVRPAAKTAFLWSTLRLEGLTTRRSVEHGQRVEFLDFEIAHLEPYEFLGPGRKEVLVDAHFSTVSPGTERAVLCGLPGARRAFPYAPGYSTAGVVRAAGSGAAFAVNDRVAGRMGHASRGVMTPTSLFRVPEAVPLKDASFMELAIICQQGIRKAGLRPGDRVAVVGMGLIGQMAARLARIAGADPLIGIASSRRRARSVQHVVDEFVALNDDPEAMRRIGADVVIEAVGSARGIVQAMDAVRDGGTVVLLGSSRDLGRGLDWYAIAQRRSVTLVGAHISNLPAQDPSTQRWTYEQEGRLFLDLLATGRLSVADMVTWNASPSECNQVYEIVAEGGRDHVAIVFDWQKIAAPSGGTAK